MLCLLQVLSFFKISIKTLKNYPENTFEKPLKLFDFPNPIPPIKKSELNQYIPNFLILK